MLVTVLGSGTSCTRRDELVGGAPSSDAALLANVELATAVLPPQPARAAITPASATTGTRRGGKADKSMSMRAASDQTETLSVFDQLGSFGPSRRLASIQLSCRSRSPSAQRSS